MLRRIALFTGLLTAAGAATVAVSAPASAAGVTSSNVTSPASGTHFMITDANASPLPTFTVTGTTNGTTGDHVDIRCYTNPYSWNNGASNVAVLADGSFTTSLSDYSTAYGSCVLRAVPTGYASGGNLRAFTGPKITTEWNISKKISGGPNDGKIYDFYVEYQSARAMNDYCSTSCGGLWDSRLSYADGSSSNYLWYANAALGSSDLGGTRAGLQVDGHNAYLPRAAEGLFGGSHNLVGWVPLTYSASRNSATGTTTIRSVEPAVRCSSDTFPPTALSCTSFVSAGVRLERTIVADDGGRQVHVYDTWRSTNGHAHTVSAHYSQEVQGSDPTPPQTSIKVGLKLPWLSGAYQTFTTDKQYAGPSRVPNSMFVRDDNAALDGSFDYPRGALSFDVAPAKIHRSADDTWSLNDDAIKVPAGGWALVRQAFVMGNSEAEVAGKAAANRAAINPYRPDASIKRKSAASYTGRGVYGTTGAHQTVLSKNTRGTTATFDVLVQNKGTATDSFVLRGARSGSGFSVRYFTGTSGGSNITSAVTHGTYVLGNLAPGQWRVLRVVVTVNSGASLGTHSWLVQARSAHDGTRRDAVRAAVKVTG